MLPNSTGDWFGPAAAFRTTLWNSVLTAGTENSSEAFRALEDLCARYWYPLYAFVRRRGHTHADAADITQSFFQRMIEKRTLANVSREGGRFRSFLLTSLKNFLLNEWRNANRQKRGGGKEIVSIDDTAADTLYLEESTTTDPEQLFDKRWALSVVERALTQLRSEFVASERADLFDQLKESLSAPDLDRSYAEIGNQFGLNEDNVKMTVHRLRKRFRRLVREEIAQTVRDQAEVEDELRHLIACLAAQ